MPRIKPPRKVEELPEVIEDPTPPTEDVVIELSDDEIDGLPAIETVGQQQQPDVQVQKPEPQEEPDDAIKRAVEAQQRAEQYAQQVAQERDEAIRRAREHEENFARERGERADAEYNSILTGISAEENAIEKAEADYAAAMQANEWTTAAKAQREMAIASARLDRLQFTKREYDQVRDAAKTNPPQQQQPEPRRTLSVEENIAALNVPAEAKTWLRAHPELISDPAQRDALGAAHDYIVKRRHIAQFSRDYFEALDTEFGFKGVQAQPTAAAAPAASAAQPQQQQRRSVPMAAPVSRDVPTASGQRQTSSQITLSPEEREIARSSFSDPTGKMTNADKERLYAMNKAKLIRERAAGRYPARERA